MENDLTKLKDLLIEKYDEKIKEAIKNEQYEVAKGLKTYIENLKTIKN